MHLPDLMRQIFKVAKIICIAMVIPICSEKQTSNSIDEIHELTKKLEIIQHDLNSIASSLNSNKQPQPQEAVVKYNTIVGQTKKVILTVYQTTAEAVKFVLTNSDAHALLSQAFKSFLKIILISLIIAYLLFLSGSKLIQYYKSVYNHAWHSIALDFSFTIFLSIFIIALYFVPQIDLVMQDSTMNTEIRFMFTALNSILFSILLVSALSKSLNYIKNKIIYNTKPHILRTLILICIVWATSNIIKSFVAISEIKSMDAEVMKDIELIRDFFYVLVLIQAIVALRHKLQYKFKNKNIWIKHLTGLESLSLVILYIIMIFWIKLNISYKLTRSIISMILWPLLIASSIFLRKYILTYARKMNLNYRAHVINIYKQALRTIKVAVAPVAIIITLRVWGISVYSNISVITGQILLNKILSLFSVLCISWVVMAITKHILVTWMFNKTKENEEYRRKFEILFKILRSGSKFVIGFACFLIALSILGYNTSQIIPALGFLSLGLSFSVKDIIADLVNGAFIIMENTIMVGDLIVIEGKNGRVEDMTLRYMQVRQDNGTLVTIPFHQVAKVLNKSRNFMGVLVNIAVTYETNYDDAIIAVEDSFNILRAKKEFMNKVFLPLEMRGLSEINGIYYTVFARIKVVPGQQFIVQRALNKIIKDVFDSRGIKMPADITLGHLNKAPSTATALPDSLIS